MQNQIAGEQDYYQEEREMNNLKQLNEESNNQNNKIDEEQKQNNIVDDNESPTLPIPNFNIENPNSNSFFKSQSSLQQQQNDRKSTPLHAFMNLFKGYIGSGILALPYAFNQAGWLLSMLIFILVAIIIYETMNLLFELADSFEKEGVDYQFLARHHFGRKGQFIVRTFLIIFQIGCCISYIIFFIKFLENVFEISGTNNNNATSTSHQLLYLLIALCVIIPMSFINSLAAFAKISIVANIMLILTLLAILQVVFFMSYQVYIFIFFWFLVVLVKEILSKTKGF